MRKIHVASGSQKDRSTYPTIFLFDLFCVTSHIALLIITIYPMYLFLTSTCKFKSSRSSIMQNCTLNLPKHSKQNLIFKSLQENHTEVFPDETKCYNISFNTLHPKKNLFLISKMHNRIWMHFIRTI